MSQKDTGPTAAVWSSLGGGLRRSISLALVLPMSTILCQERKTLLEIMCKNQNNSHLGKTHQAKDETSNLSGSSIRFSNHTYICFFPWLHFPIFCSPLSQHTVREHMTNKLKQLLLSRLTFEFNAAPRGSRQHWVKDTLAVCVGAKLRGGW